MPGLSGMFQVSWRWHCQIFSSVWSYFRFHHSTSLSPNASLVPLSPTLLPPHYFQHCCLMVIQLSNALRSTGWSRKVSHPWPPCIGVSSFPSGQVPAVRQTIVMDSIMAGPSGHSIFTSLSAIFKAPYAPVFSAILCTQALPTLKRQIRLMKGHQIMRIL